LHRYQLAATSYFDSSPYLQRDNFPPNESISGLAEGLATAHKAYVSQGGNPRSKILFVVQPGERNVFDQKWLEFELLEKWVLSFPHHPWLLMTIIDTRYTFSDKPSTT
jgi:hypothetical protein